MTALSDWSRIGGAKTKVRHCLPANWPTTSNGSADILQASRHSPIPKLPPHGDHPNYRHNRSRRFSVRWRPPVGPRQLRRHPIHSVGPVHHLPSSACSSASPRNWCWNHSPETNSPPPSTKALELHDQTLQGFVPPHHGAAPDTGPNRWDLSQPVTIRGSTYSPGTFQSGPKSSTRSRRCSRSTKRLASGSAGLQMITLVPKVPRNPWHSTGQLDPAGAPPAYRTLPVPHQHLGHRAQLLDQTPPAGIQIRRRSGGQQHRQREPGVATHHGQHRQQLRRPGLAEPDRQLNIREPEISLGHPACGRNRPTSRIRRQIRRTSPPGHAMFGSSTASQHVQRSPSPAASAETPAATPESVARTHRPATPPAPAHTSADPRWLTPPSRCSSSSPPPA